MKKILTSALVLATLLVACTDDYTDWAAPQQSEPEEAMAVSLSVSVPSAIDIASLKEDSTVVFTASVSAPEGSTVTAYSLTLNDTQQLPVSLEGKAAVDEAWNKAGFDNVTRERVGVFQESYNKLREQFNNSFDSMSKAERAELLYKILKVKNSMERGSKGSGSTSTPVMYPGKSIKPDRNDPNSYSRKLKDALSALGSNEVVMPAHKVGSIKDTRNALSDSWVVSDNMSAE